jgi:hypothetical protein
MRRATKENGSHCRWTRLVVAALGSLLVLPIAVVESKAILGVDLGSLYMKVALVQRGAPLEVVTNMHSKRKTEIMILFDAGTRFYGADASSLLARKPLKTPSQMTLMLGRDDQHPSVQVGFLLYVTCFRSTGNPLWKISLPIIYSCSFFPFFLASKLSTSMMLL